MVGESHYQRALRFVAGGRAAGDDFDSHLPAVALVVPEPDNKWDANAVRIDLVKDQRAYKVGYLASTLAAEYQPELLLFERAGFVGTCQAFITGGRGDKNYGVYLHLAWARDLRLFLRRELGVVVEERDGLAILCPDSNCAVTKEERHQDVLRGHAPEQGRNYREVVATLGFCDITTGKYKGEKAIEVRIDGDTVGQLTYAMTSRYADVVNSVLARGLTPACTAHVTDTDKGLQVTLAMPDARLYQ